MFPFWWLNMAVEFSSAFRKFRAAEDELKYLDHILIEPDNGIDVAFI
jgi:hypothetical protein